MSATLLQNALQQFSATATHTAPLVASLLVASIWRGVVLACVVALSLSVLPRLSAEVRSAIWLSLLAVVVILPLFPAASLGTHSSLAPPALRLGPHWSYALVGAWAIFSLLRLLQLAVSAFGLRALIQRSTPIAADANVRCLLAASTRRVQLCTSAKVDRPSVVGFLRPRILLPESLLGKLDTFELEQIVLHELEHLRRRDDWTNLLQKLSLALLPLHPVVFWLDRRLCLERELACDDGVLRATHSRRSYAACLTNLAEQSLFRRGVSLALGALGNWKPKSEVAKRVCRILREPEVTMGHTQSRIAAGALLAGVFAAAVALARTPHLVSFTPETTIAEFAAAAAPVPSRIPTEHVVTTQIMPAPHAALAKAVITPRATTAVFRMTRKPSFQRTTQLRRTLPPTNSPQPAAVYRLAAWQDTENLAAHFTLAVQQNSQFTYAAVPVQGGWLIIQI